MFSFKVLSHARVLASVYRRQVVCRPLSTSMVRSTDKSNSNKMDKPGNQNTSTGISTQPAESQATDFKGAAKSMSSSHSSSDSNASDTLSDVTLPTDMDGQVQKAEQADHPDAHDEAAADDFLTTIFENMEPYIDTYEVYKQLVKSGFSPSQSDEIINMLIFQLNTKLSKLSTKYSQSYELENERYLFESAQQELRVDITRNREHHINESINQINVLERDFGTISDELNNRFIQMKNDIQVAINDQKSENTLMCKKIMLRIQETNHKITTELNMAMRSEIESLRWHLSRWGLIAILVSVFSSCAAFYVYKLQTKTKSNQNQFVPLVIYEPSELDEDDYHADLDPNVI